MTKHIPASAFQTETWPCEHCSEQFSDAFELRRHHRARHTGKKLLQKVKDATAAMFRKKGGEKKVLPKPVHIASLVRSGASERLADQIIAAFGKACNGTLLREVRRLNEANISSRLGPKDRARVEQAYYEQKARNEAWKRKVAV